MINKLKSTKLSLFILAMTGILIIPSAIIGPKVAGVVLLMFVLSVVWNVVLGFGKDVFVEVGNHAIKTSEDDWNSQKYFKSSVYFLVVPISVVGIIMVGIMIFGLLFLF